MAENIKNIGENPDPSDQQKLLDLLSNRNLIRFNQSIQYIQRLSQQEEVDAERQEDIRQYLDAKLIAEELKEKLENFTNFSIVDLAVNEAWYKMTENDASMRELFSSFHRSLDFGLYEVTSDQEHELILRNISNPLIIADEIANARALALLMKFQNGTEATQEALTNGFAYSIASEYAFAGYEVPPLLKLALDPEQLQRIEEDMEQIDSISEQDIRSRVNNLMDAIEQEQREQGTDQETIKNNIQSTYSNLDLIANNLRLSMLLQTAKFDTITSIEDILRTYVNPLMDLDRLEKI